MPFVHWKHRDNPDPNIPGDRCYVHYRKMMDEWKMYPRWTTADSLLKEMFPDDNNRAYMLAFLVFFVKWVMPYEAEKERENGGIE